MNHNDLLTQIDLLAQPSAGSSNNKPSFYKALRAVVELHKPYVPAFIEADVAKDGGGTCLHCSLLAGNSLSVPHPCPTIQAIEKELK